MGVYRQVRHTPPPTLKTVSFPACVGGINALSPLMGMPITDCVDTQNLMPSEYSMRLRKGYTEWANGVGGEVRTIIAFEGQAADTSKDRLWAVSEDGIFDVSLQNTTNPTQVATFPNQGPEAGYGVFTEFTNDAAEHYLDYADAKNGLWQYSETSGLWTQPTITGPDPAKIAFVMTWKNRLWFIEQDSGDAWYLPPDAITGTAIKFTFASKFTHGGELIGLWNWTVDGGDGVDDFLIAVSRGGDVLVYHGSDPSLPDFGLRGSFFLGEVPNSRRIAVEYGGELYLLSTYGITSIRDLLKGVAASDKGQTPSAKISRFLRSAVELDKEKFNWALTIHPADGFLQIITPYTQPLAALQYNQNLLTKAWGRWRGVPVNCADTWSGDYFIGDKNGSVFLYDGVLDGTLLDGTIGQPISFEVLTSFQAPENHATFKRVGIIRPIGILAGTTALNMQAIYDYKIDTIIADPPAQAPIDGSEWDEANWDEGVWDFSLVGASLPVGSAGMGRTFAIGMRGSAATRLNLIGWDVLYTAGGPL